jgi:hypothetical protein
MRVPKAIQHIEGERRMLNFLLVFVLEHIAPKPRSEYAVRVYRVAKRYGPSDESREAIFTFFRQYTLQYRQRKRQ